MRPIQKVSIVFRHWQSVSTLSSSVLLGYKEFVERDVTINANSAVRVDVRFALGKLTETTTVTADALRVETQSTQLGDVIEGAKMTSVPLNGRAFTDLLALQPGVSPYQNVEATYVNRPVSGNLNSGNQSINGVERPPTASW